MGEDRFGAFLEGMKQPAPVSIRLNPLKAQGLRPCANMQPQQVEWCKQGWYLNARPQFTFDPLFHAGVYYVQEASSMFLDHVLRTFVHQPVSMLDLCAAPGGKTTCAFSALPEGSRLMSNEPLHARAQILKENVIKFGSPDIIVTNNYVADYARTPLLFDVILTDVPCSGEGMFRKDEATIREWSPQQVEKCWKLQREIVSDAWACLNDGGLLVYSTCTFNTKENEENVRWMMEELGAEVLPVETKPEWNITGSLLDGFNEPVYRFIPGITRGEGLFMCVVRKAQGNDSRGNGGTEVRGYENTSSREKKERRNTSRTFGLEEADPRTHVPSKIVNLSYQQAIAYLRGEALVLPEDTPRGIVEVGFMGYRLGEMKNIGTRANNLYPKEWRIKTTHIPNEYEAILRHT